MMVNGWTLYTHPLFDDQLQRLADRVKAAAKADPLGYQAQPATKLLATIHRLTRELIPTDPAAPEFRQGNTLGKENRHWFRAKFHERYRLFFRFSTKDKVIIYVWVNDEASLRKAGARNDPYALFQAMLESGDPPENLAQLLKASRELS
jgi:toxin YhaV